jgi:hypothetical protein
MRFRRILSAFITTVASLIGLLTINPQRPVGSPKTGLALLAAKPLLTALFSTVTRDMPTLIARRLRPIES